ncbi:MAG: tetratricopeptide repeat protein [Deltaproteobacteria bacterium]|nr:tetratricopeptide repeat protein [Deltaproteobacteria bacterium]
MGGTREIAPRWLCSALVLCGALIASGPTSAQNRADDAAARKQFERGRAAFEQSNYDQALMHFRNAYRLSHRGQLQYNIGITAARLQSDEEALVAFQDYLEEVENPPREQEVRNRIAGLEQAIEAKRVAVVPTYEGAGRSEDAVGRKVPKSAIVGSSVLGAVGVAGIVTMGVGLAQSGRCVEESNGTCVSERSTSPWTWVYGSVGVAALAGSVTWILVSRKRTKNERTTAWMLTPTGVLVSGSF